MAPLRRAYRRLLGGDAQRRRGDPMSSSAIRSAGRIITESDEIVGGKRRWRRNRAGLIAIVCVGETKAERDAGKALDVVGRQIAGSVPDGASASNLVVAYEPVWAIGTGVTPTVGGCRAGLMGLINLKLSMKLSVGAQTYPHPSTVGPVKPSNCKELLDILHVNGALVGGASLKAADFLAIAAAVPKITVKRPAPDPARRGGDKAPVHRVEDRATSTLRKHRETGRPVPVACDGKTRCRPSSSSSIS